MKNRKKTKAAKLTMRSASGLTLSGIAASLVAASIVFFLLSAVSMNAYAYYSYHGKAETIASEVAKLVGNRANFLGAKRPYFQTTGRQSAEKTRELAQKYTLALCKALSVPAQSDTATELLANESSESNLELTKVRVTLKNIPLPFDIPGVMPRVAEITAIGTSSEACQAPPAFIRLGFQLQDPSTSNPSVTDATQVVMLPAYGFQTDFGNVQNLGGTQNNNDVVGNQPDARNCLWIGLNGSAGKTLRSNAPYITGPDGKRVTAFN